MILGIETSSAIASVAVGTEESIRSELIVHAGLTHSEQLVPHIDRVLEMGQVKKSQITGIAVTIGPGSFTGIRIGLGTAKALAYAWQVPLVGVRSTDVLSEAFSYTNHRVYTLIDAQKKQVYATSYRWNGTHMDEIDEIGVHESEELLQTLEIVSAHESIIIVGDGIKRIQDGYDERIKDHRFDATRVMLAKESYRRPRATHVITCSLESFQKQESLSMEEVEPFYIRKSEAEVVWDKKNEELLNSNTYVEPTVITREAAGER